MINYEELELLTLTHQPIAPTQAYQPNLIHLDDPAESAIINFSSHPAITISPSESIENALFEMRSHDIHTILVIDNQHVIGILSSNDILGNKPIQLLQEKRINREQIQVHMIMSNINDSIFIDTKTLSFARVGNIVKTLKNHKKQYLLALDPDNKIYGLFTASRISKLLHKEL